MSRRKRSVWLGFNIEQLVRELVLLRRALRELGGDPWVATIQRGSVSQRRWVMTNRGARYLNILLGIWLFISTFLWRHSPSQFTNTWIMGLVAVVAGVIALGVPAVRFVNTFVGMWLVVAGFNLPGASSGTRWNNVLVGIGIFFVSLIGSRATSAPSAA